MHEVLESLAQVPGILGSLVATTDGIVVQSRLGRGLDDDAAAALVSSLLSGTMSLLDGVGKPRMEQLILKATRGKVIVSDLGHIYLVVVTNKELDLNQGLIEIKSAATQLKKKACLGV